MLTRAAAAKLFQDAESIHPTTAERRIAEGHYTDLSPQIASGLLRSAQSSCIAIAGRYHLRIGQAFKAPFGPWTQRR